MSRTRIARNVSTAAVATIAAWSSWSHMVHVALRFGERAEVAYVLPISVDGMLIVASAAMVEDKRSGRDVRWSARIAFVAGVAASVAANIAAAEPTLGARIVAAWPAVAMLLVVEILSRSRPRPEMAADSGANKPDRVAAADTAREASAGRKEHPRPSETSAATGQRSNAPRRSGVPGQQRDRAGRTTDAALQARVERPEASLADIAAQVGVSERHVRRLLTSGRDGSPRAVRSPVDAVPPTVPAGRESAGVASIHAANGSP